MIGFFSIYQTTNMKWCLKSNIFIIIISYFVLILVGTYEEKKLGISSFFVLL